MKMSSIVNLVVPHIQEIVWLCTLFCMYVSFLMVLFLMLSIGGFAIIHLCMYIAFFACVIG